LLGIAGLITQKISVIVPNFNYAQYLGERLRSIFDQSHPIFELIVLDDASTDNSLKVLETLRGELGREFRVVANDKNSGNVFTQWARGVELARGDLIWIAEADDIAQPNFLDRLAHSFSGSDTRFAFCDSRAIDSSGNELSINYKQYYSKVGVGYLAEDERLAASDFAIRHLSERNLILNVSAVLWRKDCLRDALAHTAQHLDKVRLVGDWLTYISACTGPGSVFYCAEKLNSHRRHESGVTSRMAIRKQVHEIALGHEFFNRLFGEDDNRLTAQAQYLDELRLKAEAEPA
jgi:glycosyltransferase involved in cell wall biosynthesis